MVVGPESAKRLGYDAAEMDALPVSVTESFSGVGNPLAPGELRRGDVVLDPAPVRASKASLPRGESVPQAASSASISCPRWSRRRSGTPPPST